MENLKLKMSLSNDQLFLIVSFVLSLLLSFLFGYMVFRYWQIDVCKSPMHVVEDIYK